MNRVSVICAAYNGEQFIEKTINSLKCQTEKFPNIIIIDDNSTDRTFEIASSFNNKNIILQKNSINSGVVATRNIGISFTDTPYIAINDQDDISLPHRLKIQADFLDNNPQISCVYSKYECIDQDDKIISNTKSTAVNYSGELARPALLFKNFITHSTIMFRRSAIKGDAYVANYPLCEDYSLLIRLSNVDGGLQYMPNKLIKYRMHSNNYSQAKSSHISDLSTRLKLEILNNLDIHPISSELIIHNLFSSETFTPEISLFNKSREWLQYLENANLKNEYFNPEAFKIVLANEWLEFCHRFTKFGRTTWKQFIIANRPVPLSSKASVMSLWVKTHLRNSF